MMFEWLKRSEFTWLNKQGVVSRKGFSLQRTGRFTAEYREGDHRLTIDVEPGVAEGDMPCVTVSPDAFSRWDGSDTDLSLETRAIIRGNVERALQFQGMMLEVVEPVSFFDQLIQQRDSYLQWLQAGKKLSLNGVEISDAESLDSFIESHRGQ